MYAPSHRLWLSGEMRPGRGRLIVADPDESVFMMVRQLTAPDRWEVRYAATASEFRELLHTQPAASLAIVGVSMLDASPELATELLERSRRGLRVVVTTDEHSERNERRARLIGPVCYAPKPVNVVLLNHVLDGALRAAV